MRYEVCACQRCGYKYVMPDIGYLGLTEWGTFDVASWAYCTVECLLIDCGEGHYDELPWWYRRLYRPIFRWWERRKYTNAFRNELLRRKWPEKYEGF